MKEIDYEQRHYEVAKEILAARFNTLTKLKTHPKRQVEMAIHTTWFKEAQKSLACG